MHGGDPCKTFAARTAAVGPRLVGEVDLDDARPGREHERLRELLLADHPEHGLERRARVRVEGAAEVGDVDAREEAEDAGDKPRGQRAAPGVLAAHAPAARDVEQHHLLLAAAEHLRLHRGAGAVLGELAKDYVQASRLAGAGTARVSGMR